MSGQFTANHNAVDDLGTELARRCGRMRATDVAGPLQSAAEALPSSQTARAATTVAVHMGTALAALAERVDDAATTAHDTARAYSTSDDRNAQRLARLQ